MPIVIKRMAFGESRDDHSEECHNKEPANELQTDLIGSFPDMAREAFEEFGDGEFGDP